MNGYPKYILKAIRRTLGVSEDDDSMDEEIYSMPKDEIFDSLCEYNGIIHYGQIILNWVDDIFNVNLLNLG